VLRQTAYNLVEAVPRLADLARQVRAEVVVTNTIAIPSGALAALRVRLPHVWYVHEFGDLDHGLRFHWGRRTSVALVNRTSAAVVVNSEALRAHFGRWIPARKLHLVPYAVDVPDRPRDWPAASRPCRMVLVGGKSPGKGQTDAIEALARLRSRGHDARLELVGGGDPAYVATLEELAVRCGVRDQVDFVGFQADPLARFRDAHVALMCSRSEAFGRVTIEALKMGRPVIGTATGATPELVRPGENGFLYPPGRAEELSARMEELCADLARARAMGERGRKWARERFTMEAHGAALETAIRSAVDSFRKG
jgi:glycosyltransferase involved in cell wall biosynthesis